MKDTHNTQEGCCPRCDGWTLSADGRDKPVYRIPSCKDAACSCHTQKASPAPRESWESELKEIIGGVRRGEIDDSRIYEFVRAARREGAAQAVEYIRENTTFALANSAITIDIDKFEKVLEAAPTQHREGNN